MAKNKQRKKGSSKACTSGSKGQSAASQTGAKAATPNPASSKSGKASMPPSLSRRNALRAVVASVVVVGAGTAIHRHDVQARDLHDLSAVGEGMPTVVQIHDPSCPLCRRLMGATRKAIEDFPSVTYRVADITTREGQSFQTKYDVPNVTLLLFDSQGRHLETLNGVRDADELRELFAQAFGESATGVAQTLS